MANKNEEILKKIQENREKNKGVNGVYERYFNDILTYMKEKFPDEPIERVMEAAGFVTGRAYVFMCDMMVERDKEWKRFNERELRKYKRRLEE
jgi:hemerythrin